MSGDKIQKQAERSDVALNDTWDLTSLYATNDAWESDFQKLDGLIEAVDAFKGTLGESPKTLASFFACSEKLERILMKVYTYAHLKSDEDLDNSENRARLDKIMMKYAEVQGRLSWDTPEILAIPEDVMDGFLKSDELTFYNRSLKELLRSRPHVLSEKEERLLGFASEVLGSSQKTFSALNDADMKFPTVKDESGSDVELTHGNYIKFLESSNRDVRKGAFDGMYKTVSQYRNTFSTTLDATVKKHVLTSKLRSYPSALEASLHSDNIPRAVYTNLIDTVHESLPELHRYFQLRKTFLGVDNLDMHDLYTPLVKDYSTTFSWEQAQEMVESAVIPMGEEYTSILKKAFTERWVDVYENRGKRSGAYSSGCYDSNPYILMNYNGTLNHVFTLAHELGHSLHSYYSRHAQEAHYADYRIFVAEVASTTNELLLHDHLMKTSDDPQFKRYLLNHLLEQIRGTVFRQTMFSEFELMIHEMSEKGIPLTPDQLSNSYYELNKKYHGDAVDADKLIAMEWARIPHFYYNFYVYKYATGFSAAVQLSQNILNGTSRQKEAYIEFLKAGDTKDVLDIMRDAGVDLSTPQPIKECVSLFTKTLNELETVI